MISSSTWTHLRNMKPSFTLSSNVLEATSYSSNGQSVNYMLDKSTASVMLLTRMAYMWTLTNSLVSGNGEHHRTTMISNDL
jgi:hypothetical protein